MFQRLLFCSLFTLLCTSKNVFALCVQAPQANLRAEPKADAKLIWTVGKYMPLLALKQKGSWIQVRDVDGARAWIHESLVSDQFDCAVVRVGKAQLRKGPGTEFANTPLSTADKYMPFKKLQREGAWLYLEDDYGFKHWVVENNIWEPLAYTRLNY